jgi:hypothetical protein
MKWWDNQRSQSDRVLAARREPTVAAIGAAPLLRDHAQRSHQPSTRQRAHVGFRGYAPPRRTIRWPFSAFQTVIMIVFPLFWPILGVMLAAEVFCLVMYAAMLIVGNMIMLAVWLVALAFSR